VTVYEVGGDLSVVSPRSAAFSFAHVAQGWRLALPPSLLNLSTLLPKHFTLVPQSFLNTNTVQEIKKGVLIPTQEIMNSSSSFCYLRAK